MNVKKNWLRHSLVWLGVLCSSPECAYAETIVPFTAEASTQESHPIDRLSTQSESDRPLESSPGIGNISPAETFPNSLEPDNLLSLPRKASLVGKAETQSDVEAPNHIPLSPYPDIPLSFEPEFNTALPNKRISLNMGTASPCSNLSLASATPSPDEIKDRENDQTTDEPPDPELGNLRLRERELTAERDRDTVFLLGRVSYFKSDNILLDSIDPVDDQLIRGGISLLAVPSLGPRTQLVASINGNLARYSDLSELDYNDLEFRAGIRQTLFPRTYAEIGWSNRQFFSTDDGDRFLNDHSIRLSLNRRDQLAPQLTLRSFYQLRFGFADPSDRSRITNTLGASLNYDLQPNLTVGLNYQLVLTDFTQESREDGYQQITAQLNYDLTRNSRVSLFAGFSFGQSSDPDVDFDSSIFGIGFDMSLSLF